MSDLYNRMSVPSDFCDSEIDFPTMKREFFCPLFARQKAKMKQEGKNVFRIV